MVKETIRFVVLVLLFGACLVGVAMLAGCSANDFKYAECIARDRTSNPCN